MFRLVKASLAAALVSLSVSVAPVGAASNNLASEFPLRMLAAHNVVRAEAGVSPLSWDPALADQSARYAMELAFTNSFQHSNRKARPGVGENLWMGTHSAYSFEAMISGWSGERRYFVPGVFPAVSRSGDWEDVGHYTQMVWPTTTRVGCAVASNASRDFLVCHYSPAGNIDGRPMQYATATAARYAGR